MAELCGHVHLQAQVSGNFPNNTANILNTTVICNSVVHLVDKVLLPTDALATVPAPGNGLNQVASQACLGTAHHIERQFPGK